MVLWDNRLYLGIWAKTIPDQGECEVINSKRRDLLLRRYMG